MFRPAHIALLGGTALLFHKSLSAGTTLPEGRHGLEHPVRRRYAVWTGIGAVGTATLGIFLFGEPATVLRLASIGLIVAGIVGLKLVT